MNRPPLRYWSDAAIFASSAGWRYELAITIVPSSGPGKRAASQVSSVQHSRRKRSSVMRWSEIHNDSNAGAASRTARSRSASNVAGSIRSILRLPVGGL